MGSMIDRLLNRTKGRLREAVGAVELRLARSRLSVDTTVENASTPVTSVVLLPADGRDPVGSRGDEAMITALCDHLTAQAPGVRIYLATNGCGLSDELRNRGVIEVPVWTVPWRLRDVWSRLSQYDAAIVVGADVMDGYYSSVTSLRLWMTAELFARSKGRHRGIVAGCSFGPPTREIRGYLRRGVSSNLTVNLRDPRSHRRLAGYVPNGHLVADCAFMLRPQRPADLDNTLAFIDRQRSDGRVVCGINIHPMLSRSRDPREIDALVEAFAEEARRLVDSRNCAVVLIPHDFRGDLVGDVGILSRVLESASRPDRVHLDPRPISAAAIKTIAGRVDLVITGRMHLAIAALGSGRPAIGISYQEKFEGLFVGHFGLDDYLLLPAGHASQPQALAVAVDRALGELESLTTSVRDTLPSVRALAQQNLAPLLGDLS